MRARRRLILVSIAAVGIGVLGALWLGYGEPLAQWLGLPHNDQALLAIFVVLALPAALYVGNNSDVWTGVRRLNSRKARASDTAREPGATGED
jgi:hypothetical protein